MPPYPRPARRPSSSREWLSVAVLLILLVALGVFLYWQYSRPQLPPPPPATGPLEGDLVFGGEPRSREPVTILRNLRYIVGYSEARKDPLWVGYRLTGGIHPAAPRPRVSFEVDLRTRARVSTRDYDRSGYDRGHMAPSHAIGACFGPEAQIETFLMSNICPQVHAMNAGPWQRLERAELDEYAGRFGQVWILDGPVFEERPAELPRGIQIPRAFYKILIENHAGRPSVRAVVMPQTAAAGDKPEKYLASVRQIEAATGLDFLYLLPQAEEDELESTPAAALW